MRALVLRQQNDFNKQSAVENVDIATMPAFSQLDHCVKVKVAYSSLNYKDALAICHKGKIVKQFPFIPGIDLVGEIVDSANSTFDIGQQVILTGFGYGEKYCGGMADFAFVQPQHLTLLPENLSPKAAMALGTAGFTAMLCVNALLAAQVTPNKGEIVVSGATGGVGSIAIYLLSRLGYQVSAISGKSEQYPYLEQLGATQIYTREEMSKPTALLEKQQFAGAIDTVGGSILANILSKIKYNGCVAACGLAQNYQLNTNVMPFILRNVRLQGVDSVYYPAEKRAFIWEQLANAIADNELSHITTEIGLEQATDYANKLLTGQLTGRAVIKVA